MRTPIKEEHIAWWIANGFDIVDDDEGLFATDEEEDSDETDEYNEDGE